MAWTNSNNHGSTSVIGTDVLQWVFVVVSVFDLIFFSYYLFVFEMNEQSMISDTLFTRGEYATVLTVTLAARLLGGVLFLMRYMRDRPWWTTMGIMGECLTLMGWYWLVLHKDNGNHFAGVGLFCLGSLLYSMVFIRLGAISHKHLRLLHQWLMGFLLIATIGLVVAFVAIWAMEEKKGQHDKPSPKSDNYYEILAQEEASRKAYIVEHAAYVTHLLFYLGFFSFHSPNPNVSPNVSGNSEYESDQHGMLVEMDENVSACQPLILANAKRLPSIMETH